MGAASFLILDYTQCFVTEPSDIDGVLLSKAKEYIRFLAAFAAKPFRMGAIAPSSKRLAEMMLLGMSPADLVVEIGPGTGAITRIIRQRLQDPKTYLGFDINREFIEKLRHEFPDLNFHQESAENLGTHFQNGTQPDTVVCSLPWAIWPAQHQARVLEGIIAPLKNGGHFATFAYWPTMYAPAGFGFRKMLSKSFKKVERTKIVWGNLPPAVVYVCVK
jgi:phosphatidylethanolamine/phosphatidyl-N-methylethanolamine N-methyltransferase